MAQEVSKSDAPRAGQIYTRGVHQREVVSVESEDDWKTFYVYWRRPGKPKLFRAWCSTWLEWVSKATLVENKDS